MIIGLILICHTFLRVFIKEEIVTNFVLIEINSKFTTAKNVTPQRGREYHSCMATYDYKGRGGKNTKFA